MMCLKKNSSLFGSITENHSKTKAASFILTLVLDFLKKVCLKIEKLKAFH